MSKVVIVTGIGGNVGQGILKNIRSFNPSIKIIGINVVEHTAGNHLCDKVYKVPYGYDPAYIEVVEEIIEKESADLILPSTDYETYSLSKNGSGKAIVSPFETCEVFIDKYKTYESFTKHNIPFAKSWLPSSFQIDKTKNCIYKPREGRGSRGIVINPTDTSSFTDKDYMVQEFLEGKEMTTAFYVNKQGELHGHMSMYRELGFGATVSCSVTFENEEKVKELILNVMRSFKIIGACNIQSIVDKKGNVVPFEINCRISGTNSIRPYFGFADVKYILQEYLYNENAEKPSIINGSALRILSDIIYPDVESIDQIGDCNTKHILF